MAEPQDVDALRRRGRRRLVGAIALVLLAVIVLPMVFEQQPKQSAPVSVRIPSEDQGALPAPVQALPPAQTSTPAQAPAQTPSPAQTPAPAPAAKPDSARTEPAPEHSAAPKADAKAATKTENLPASKVAAAEHARAEAALEGKEFIVPVAALAEPQRVKALTARLRSAKLPYYTEAINTKHGKVTRVRVGPFASREAAERAHAKLVKLGLRPGAVAVKS